ncbi:hypothetical protein GH714_021219 [Hevea brasiliensis]|uniref:dCTP pyrophosphatase 1 n=1 Tax=Hevea brasiliensis TaxID=3981 RepID=A0A6A6MFP3_HEVBR|nr:hypothetical protein GH714_021219 [Hevea brasiliensis]
MESSCENARKYSNSVSLQELRDSLAGFAEDRGWDQYHSPRNLLLALVGEVGGLSEIFQWKGEGAKLDSFEEVKSPDHGNPGKERGRLVG